MRRAAAALVAAVLLAGCSGGDDRRGAGQGGFVEGETLSVYVSVPRGAPAGEDVLDGAKLALQEAGSPVGAFRVNLDVIDPSAPGEDPTTVPRVALDNALAAVKDFAATAVIGELDSRAARTTAPLFDSAGLLVVSPGAGYAALTRPRRGEPGEPGRYHPAGDAERSYARLLPSDLELAPAMVEQAGDARRIVVEEEGSAAGRALGAELRELIGRNRLATDTARADAVIYAGDDAENAFGVLDSVARENPRALLIGGDALARAGLADRLDSRRLRLVSAAPELDPAFAARFERALGRRPGPYAAVGHEAMALVLEGVRSLGEDAAVRPRLVRAVLGARRRGTLLGDYAFDPFGDTTRRAFTVVR